MEICTTLGEVNMKNLRKEVRELISINEKIQSALLHGDRMTDDEATLIRQCASELLAVAGNP
jgi:predicted phosphodiesterase